MEITRNVILDLLPLYMADEVSADTRTLVEKYLESDPELAAIAKRTAIDLPGDIPIPLHKEDKMKAYLEVKRLMFRRTVILAITISVTILCVLAFLGIIAYVFLLA